MSWSAGRLAEYPVQARYLALAPSATVLFMADDRGWALLDEKGQQIWRRNDPQTARLVPDASAWAPGGDVLFLTAGGRVRVLRAESGADLGLAADLAGRTDVTALALEDGGGRLAVGTRAGHILVHDLSHHTTSRLSGIDPVTALCWHTPLRLLAGTNNELQIWDTDGTMVRTVVMNGAGIRGICRSRVGQIAVLDHRGVQLLDLGSGRPGPAAEVASPTALAFSRDEQHLLVGTPTQLCVLDLDLVERLVLPGAVRTSGQLSRSESGVIAVRSSSGVSLFAPTDAVVPMEREYDTAGTRRWAQVMAATVGRAITVRHEQRPLVARPLPLDDAGAGCPSPGFAWTGDGGWWCESPRGRLVRVRPGVAEPIWSAYVDDPIVELAADPSGTWLAASARNTVGRVLLFDAVSGERQAVLSGGQSPVFAPDGRDLLAVPQPGETAREILIYQPSSGQRLRSLPAPETIGRLAWSADGGWLAAAADGKVIIWETHAWQRVRVMPVAPATAPVARVAWAPNGQLLAVQPVAGSGQTQIVLTPEWQPLRSLGSTGGPSWAPALAWSPDSRMIACPGQGRDADQVEIWHADNGKLLCRITAPQQSERRGAVWDVAWSPDGTTLAVTYAAGVIVRYEIGGASAVEDRPLAYPVALLATVGGHTAAQGAAVPLSLLSQLLDHTGGTAVPDFASLADLRGARALQALRWPDEARVGVVTMLGCDLAGDPAFRAPPGVAVEDLITHLRDVLLGEVIEPVAPAPAVAEVARVLQEVDERVLTLLTLLGPAAVAADPALLVRMRGLHGELTPLSPRQHRLLAMRLNLTESGPAEGGGSGDERAGLARHGNINRLLPTQLALPGDVFALQYAEGNLLFRTRRGKLPPEPRSAVILLDDTPAAHGQVGITVRTCAHLLADSLLARQRQCVLVPLGAPEEAVALLGPADLLRIWTVGSLGPTRPAAVVKAATALVRTLTDGLGVAPLTILLTHAYQSVPPVPGLRTIAVSYPRAPARPVGRRPDWRLIPAEPTAATLGSVLTQVLRESG